MSTAPHGKSNRYLTVVLITPEEFSVEHEQARLALEEENIESLPIWPPACLLATCPPSAVLQALAGGLLSRRPALQPSRERRAGDGGQA